MPSQREIARDWGCAPSYVAKCVKKGCPTDSLAAARKWRATDASRRAPTDQKSLARQVKRQQDTNSSQETNLIPFATARDMAWRGYDAILDLVLELPKNVAAECNPSNPQIAFAALEAECTYILCNAIDVIAAWSKIKPSLSFAGNHG